MDSLTQVDLTKIDDFTLAYLECALWSSVGDDGEPLDADYDFSDIAQESLAEMVSDCADFQESNAALIADLDTRQCGHDFWLTRNGHGAGFWDRGLGKVGDDLTANCKAYGSADLYIGDDGKVYQV